MPPQTQFPQQDSGDPHRMDFIMQTEVPKPKSFKEKLMTPIGAIFIAFCMAIIAVLVVVSILAGRQANQEQITKLTSLAQTQTELIRISDLGENQAKSPSIKEKAAETSRVVEAALENTKAMLSGRGADASQLDLGSKKDTQTDSAIVEALAENNFDTVFSEIMESKLLDYQGELIDAQKTGDDAEFDIFETAYTDVNNILGIKDQPVETVE